MNEELFSILNGKIQTHSGLSVANIQRPVIEKYIKSESKKAGLSIEKYIQSLEPATTEFNKLINQITVNETFFFREEAQFEVLRQKIFPKYMGSKMSIWSAACSTGEEAISLLALALSCNIDATVYASDIDETVLAKLKSGKFSLFSLRRDGSEFRNLLEPYSKIIDNQLVFNKNFINRIKTFKYNLSGENLPPFNEPIDLIFLRNVFIYFDKDTRCNVTEKVTSLLKDDGYLFFSMNEIASIDSSIYPKELRKVNSNSVYYFMKGKGDGTDTAVSVTRSKLSDPDTIKAQMLKAQARLSEKNTKKMEEKKPVRVHHTQSKRSTTVSAPHSVTPPLSAAPRPAHHFDAVREYEAVCREINGHNYDSARAIAQQILGSENQMYSFFFQGYVEYYADNKAAADRLFSTAEMICSDFWPAFFYHGLVLKDIGKKDMASFCFKKCKQILERFGGNNPYDFALDSFSPAYINSLCDTL